MTESSTATRVRQFRCRDRAVVTGKEPLMVGILNLTPDSFYDGGRIGTVETAMRCARGMLAAGAAMIDVGGQSTRPGHVEISVEEEIARVIPVITALVPQSVVPLSVDTYKPDVARAALRAGAHLVNDVYGLQRDPRMVEVCAEFGASVIVMHHELDFREAPGDPVRNIRAFFDRSLATAAEAGIKVENIVLDPGIGFAKTPTQNLEILGRLDELKGYGCPVLLGASRKSVFGHVLSLPPEERLEGTLAATALAVWLGVDFIRVHDVQANLRAAKVAYAIRCASGS